MAHRFEVAVDDSLSPQQLEAVQQRVGKSSDERSAEPLEIVPLYQLIQIHPRQKNSNIMVM